VGKGDGEHAVRWRVLLRDEIRNPVRDDARLSRARASENEQRAASVFDGGALFRIE
jgi:hypothetical protein